MSTTPSDDAPSDDREHPEEAVEGEITAEQPTPREHAEEPAEGEDSEESG